MAKLTLNKAERSELMSALVTNCAGWDEEDVKLLTNMSDDKLFAHAENCAELLTANADPEDDSGLPDSLEPDSAGAQESEADTAIDEEEDELGDQGEVVSSAKQDNDKDQPTNTLKPKSKKVSMEVTENQYLENLPPRIQSVVINALNFEHTQKEQLVGQITANSRCRFTREHLMTKDLDELQAMAELASPQKASVAPIYTGAVGGAVLNEVDIDREDILTIPTLEFTQGN